MTDNEMRVAIAEAMGWKLLGGMWHNPAGTPIGFTPDFPRDLNAIASAVETLNEHERVHFIDALLGSINCEPDYNIDDDFCSDDGWKLITATAAQRAEAFLKAKNLWKG